MEKIGPGPRKFGLAANLNLRRGGGSRSKIHVIICEGERQMSV